MERLSMVETAYRILKEEKKKLCFKELWIRVSEHLEYNEEQKEEKIAFFYTDLSLDGRFVTLGENEWDLRERNTFDKVHIDMNDIYLLGEVSEEAIFIEELEE